MDFLFPAFVVVVALAQYLRAAHTDGDRSPHPFSTATVAPVPLSRPPLSPAAPARFTDAERLAAYRGSARHRTALARLRGETQPPAFFLPAMILRPPVFDASGTPVDGLWRETPDRDASVPLDISAGNAPARNARFYCSARSDGQVIVLAALNGGLDESLSVPVPERGGPIGLPFPCAEERTSPKGHAERTEG